MRAFLDANVLFTAALTPDGKAGRIISRAAELGIQLFTNDYALTEAYRNLEKKAPRALPVFSRQRRSIVILQTITQGPVPASLPEKDRPIWLGALHAGCDVLVTGDQKDFGSLGLHPTLRVLSPAQWWEELLGT